MSRTIRLLLALLSLVAVIAPNAGKAQKATAGLRPVDLRCEYAVNPIGIGVVQPRFYWTLESARRSQRQTAYQVLVASSEAKLKSNHGDLWDSGKVSSDQSIHIAYAGTPLHSRQRAHWKVKVWDRDGKESSSAPAFFEMGLLQATDWTAKWITIKPANDEDRLPLAKSKWIYAGNVPVEAGQKLQLWRALTIPQGAKVTVADMHYAADFRDRERGTNLFVNNALDPSLWRSARQLRSPSIFNLRYALKPGENTIAVETAYGPNRGFIAWLHIELDNGQTMELPTDGQWKARVTTRKGAWTADDIKESGWTQAREVGKFGDVLGGFEVYKQIDKLFPPPYLRKGFEVRKAIKSARVYASATGVYELHLNGQRVGQDVFTPGWTDYGKRIQYQTYDVTALLKRGANAIGGIVGDGWFSGHNGLFNVNPNYYGFDKTLLAQLQIEYTDGSSEVIATDETWRGKTGPIRYSDMFMGETYDARRELPGWDAAGFNDSDWRDAIAVKPTVGPLTAQADPPVRKIMELRPKRMLEPKPGVYVFDFGQNMVGWQRVRVRGSAGHKIIIRNSEMLNVDGTIFTENLRTAIATDHYTLKGGGVESYEPSFTFHGFRYIELSNWPKGAGAPTLDTVTGVVLHSDLPMAGRFETSSKLINQLQNNIQWGQRGNFLSVPTDCPQRDERDGWTGDIQAFSRTATFNMDSAAFLAKWLVDLEHGQDAEGALPDIAPVSTTFGRGKFGWGDAGVMVPWTLYQVYDDKRMIADRFGMMKAWVEYLRRNGKNEAGEKGKGYLAPTDSYGDWVSPKPEAPKDILSTEFYARVTWQLARMAEAIGKQDEAREYRDLFEKIKSAFNQAYVGADGKITSKDKDGKTVGDTQTLYVCALRFHLVDGEMREAARRNLIAAIERSNWHLGTGFLGAVNLMPVLTDIGRTDVAYRLLLNDTMPSWGYSIKNGATTIWERWDGYDAEKGPSNMGNMNSYNHYAFGAVGEWMYANIAGIETAEPGFQKLIIHPRLGGGLTYAKGEYHSIRGKIATNWNVENGAFNLSVTIPANTTATVVLPAASAETVTEGGKPANKAEGVRLVGMKDGAAVCEIGSGTYQFKSTLK